MAAPPPTLRRAAELVAATSGYAVAALLLLAPLFNSPLDTLLDVRSVASWLLAANTDIFMRALAWDWHAFTGHVATATNAVAAANMEASLAGVFPRLGHLPIFGPLLAVSDNLIAAHQLNLFANFALSGGALYALLRYLGARPLAALVGGFVYAFAPARIGAGATPSLVAGQYLPLGLIFVLRAGDRGSWGDAALAALLLTWQASCSLVYAYSVPVVALVFGALVPSRGRAGRLRALIPAFVTAAAVVAMLIPVVTAVRSGAVEIPHAITDAVAGGAKHGLGSVQSWREVVSRQAVFRDRGRANAMALSPYVGWLGLVLAALAMLARGRRRVVAALLGCAVFGFALSLGSAAGLSPIWRMLEGLVPGSTAELLLPGHFVLVFLFAVAVLIGLGVDRALAWSPRRLIRAGLILGLVLAMAWDFKLIGAQSPIEVAVRSPYGPRVYTLLPDARGGSVLEVPVTCRLDSEAFQARALLNSYFHGLPVLNRYGAFEQPLREHIDALIAALPDGRAVELLARIAGLRYVVAHTSLMPLAERYEWLDSPWTEDGGSAAGLLLLEIAEPAEPALAQAFLAGGDRRTTVEDTALDPLPASARVVHATVDIRVPIAMGGLPITARAVVRNDSDHTWPALGGSSEQRVEIVHRWEDGDGNPIASEGRELRTPLPFDLEPGDSVAVRLCVVPPRMRGKVDLVLGVAQGAEWFRGEYGRDALEVGPYAAGG